MIIGDDSSITNIYFIIIIVKLNFILYFMCG